MNPVTAILGLVDTVVSRIWPDKTEQEKEQFTLAIQQELDKTQLLTGQMSTNAAEGASGNMFVAGWRPAVGWICALAFGWMYFVQPMFLFAVAATGHPVPSLPHLDIGEMMPILLGMLGLGGLRTYEKVNGITNKSAE
jgi:hypothetical protein